jgi:hypothetical protein
MIEEKMTYIISDMLDEMVPKIGADEVVICGDDTVRRMLGRKLEDRLGRAVKYE